MMMGVRGSIIPLMRLLSMGTATGLVKTERNTPEYAENVDRYAPLPTVEQLVVLGEGIGETVRFHRRIVGGLGGTVDVLLVGAGAGEPVVLKRYWLPEPGEISPAESEFRALALAVEHGISAPVTDLDRPDRVVPGAGHRHLACRWSRASGSGRSRRLGRSVGGCAGRHPSNSARINGSRPLPGAGRHRRAPVGDGDPRCTRPTSTGHGSLGETCRDLGHAEAEAQVYVHHDFWPGNTLWVAEKLAAVDRLGRGAIADPALDVAYCAFDMRLLGLNEAAEVSSRFTGSTRGDP